MRLARVIARELRSSARSTASLIKLKLRPPRARQLEIGSGPVRKPGWITVDQCVGADVYWDLHRALPFRNGSFDLVYCSHVLEHFYYQDLRKLLSEIYRILSPGAEFLFAVPDASRYVNAYLGRAEAASLMKYMPAVVSNEKMDILNYIFYMDTQHRFMFDNENALFHCQSAGFEKCTKRDFDPRYDLIDRDYESLYIRCRKPKAQLAT